MTNIDFKIAPEVSLNCYSRRDVEDKSSGLKVSTNTKLQVTSYKLDVQIFLTLADKKA